MARPAGGSWAARIAALAVFFVCIGLTLFAGWNLVMTPYSWATLAWAGGLVVGVAAVPHVLRFLYIITVVSTWHNEGLVADGTENRLWWLGQYTKTSTLPYGLMAVTSVFGWRLSIGNNVPLHWPWCVVIIASFALIVIVASGIPADPDMPYLRRILTKRRSAFLVGGIAVAVFAAAHFAELKWLRIALFVIVFFVVAFWTSVAAIAGAQLFLRVDYGQSSSYPLDWPWH